MLTNHELHTLSLVTRKAGQTNPQCLDRRAAMKAVRRTEFQLILLRNNQIREQETGSASLIQRHLNAKKYAV